MGRHVDDEAAADAEADETRTAAADSGTPRHAAEAPHQQGHPLEAQAVISADTHVTVDFDVLPPGTPDAPPSPARPDALVEHGLVGDGTEME